MSVKSEEIEGDGQRISEEKSEPDRERASTKTLRWAYAWSFKEQQNGHCGWNRESKAGRVVRDEGGLCQWRVVHRSWRS